MAQFIKGSTVADRIHEWIDQTSSLVDLQKQVVDKHAHSEAFVFLGSSLSYSALDQYVESMAAYCQQCLGIQKGDRVALMMPNSLVYPIAVHAILRIGAIVVNVNPLYTERELHDELRDADVSALIVWDVMYGKAQVVLKKLPAVSVMSACLADGLPSLKRACVRAVLWLKGQRASGHASAQHNFYKALSYQGSLVPVDVSRSDVAFLQYTGGTTGRAKGAVLTHGNLCANVSQCAERMFHALEPGQERVLIALPLYHIFSLTVCFFCFSAIGASGLLIPNPRDLSNLIRSLKTFPVSVFIGINTLFHALLAQSSFCRLDFSSIKLVFSGGGRFAGEDGSGVGVSGLFSYNRRLWFNRSQPCGVSESH